MFVTQTFPRWSSPSYLCGQLPFPNEELANRPVIKWSCQRIRENSHRFLGDGRNVKRGQGARGLERRRAALAVDLDERQWYGGATQREPFVVWKKRTMQTGKKHGGCPHYPSTPFSPVSKVKKDTL